MTAVVDAARYHLGWKGYPTFDGLVSSAANAQAGASSLPGELNICAKSTANGSFILDSILSGEATRIVYVLNASPNTINVWPFVGEKVNGSLNTALALTAGQIGVFIPVMNSLGETPLDWRAAAFS